MIVRSCGTVIAGVMFFPPLGFQREKPGSHERKRLMMMPAAPCANFIVGQAGLALGALQTFLDPMLGLGHARELFQRRLVRRVRQIVIMLHCAVRLTFAHHHQSLVKTFSRCGLGTHASIGACTFLYSFATVFGGPAPGGLGMADTVLVEGALSSVPGLTGGEAVAAALLIRVATLWFGVLLGAGALLRIDSVIAQHRIPTPG